MNEEKRKYFYFIYFLKRFGRKRILFGIKYILLSSFLLLLPHCKNFVSSRSTSSTTTNTASSSSKLSSLSNTSSSTMTISNITLSQNGSNATFSVFFDSQKSTASINSFCTLSQSSGSSTSKPCKCEFRWTEVNQTTTQQIPIPRLVETDLQSIQASFVTCAAPSVYQNEIPNGTVIQIRIVPKGTANSALSMNAFDFTKQNTATSNADFFDAEGRALVNILRYSCYEKNQKGLQVLNKIQKQTDSNTGSVATIVKATQFCIKKSKGGATSNDDCPQALEKGFSAQSYYYNLYLPSVNAGAFNRENQRFTCPLVQESLDGSALIGQQGKPWPMDSSFALAKSRSTQFPVSVVGPSILGVQGDSSSSESACGSGSIETGPSQDSSNGTSTSNSGSSIANKCLGFAKKPNTDGTCPNFRDANGTIRSTYRLRRFVALYPPSFDTDGSVISQPHAMDMIYVIDRPVQSPNPLKPYTMLGPKPCPFAFYDHRMALSTSSPNATYGKVPWTSSLNVKPIYKATSASVWDGKNVDNLFFPNSDNKDSLSCAALLPIVHYSAQGDPKWLEFATTHITNQDGGGAPNKYPLGNNHFISFDKVYIRPIQSWWPHYLEDTSFQACAPLAEPFRDPPLHFARDKNGNVSWCAEAYPTQNNSVEALEKSIDGTSKLNEGYIKPFTSHVVKNSLSTACTPTLPTIPNSYAAAGAGCVLNQTDVQGAARHPSSLFIDTDPTGAPICANKTCDRTVLNTGSGAWKQFPLLAEPTDIEEVLQKDPSFNCTVTWDENGSKQNKRTPTDGCCHKSVVFVNTSSSPGASKDTAHLEPDRFCLSPTY